MYRFHFTSDDVDYEGIPSWFAERNAAFCLMNKTVDVVNLSGLQLVITYDITVLGEMVALEFMLAFPVKQHESTIFKLRKERLEIMKRIKAL